MTKINILPIIALLVFFISVPASVYGQDQFLGEIRIVPYNFAPKGWADCNGQLLSLAQNTALFSLLGTYYGGDGRSTFGLPNLNGRVAVGAGQGPGLSIYNEGEQGGVSTVALTTSQIPVHTHSLVVDTANGTSADPTGRFPARMANGVPQYAAAPNGQVTSTSALGVTGSGAPHNNMMPYLGMKFVIALQGIYPPRP